MAFEMSLPHAPRIQAVGGDGAETLAQDEQQWDLYYTVQKALAAQQVCVCVSVCRLIALCVCGWCGGRRGKGRGRGHGRGPKQVQGGMYSPGLATVALLVRVSAPERADSVAAVLANPGPAI